MNDGIPWLALYLGGAVLLLGSEFIATHFFTGFLGLAALLMALLVALGIDLSPAGHLAVWSLLSAGLALLLRPAAKRWLQGESLHDVSDEDLDAAGTLVDVLEDVSEGETSGRIRFRGTTWPAISLSGTIATGQKARLVCRDKMAWVIEPLDALTADASVNMLVEPSSAATARETAVASATTDTSTRKPS